MVAAREGWRIGMRTVLLAVVLVLVAGISGGVSAKTIGAIARETGLTPKDFDIMIATARGLYDAPSPKSGRIVSWTNADSGSHGKVRLAAIRGNCAYIQHFVHPKGAERATEMRARWCRNAEGKWLRQP